MLLGGFSFIGDAALSVSVGAGYVSQEVHRFRPRVQLAGMALYPYKPNPLLISMLENKHGSQGSCSDCVAPQSPIIREQGVALRAKHPFEFGCTSIYAFD